MKTQFGLVGFLTVTPFFAGPPLPVEETYPGDLVFPASVMVDVPVGPGPHTAIVQAAFDEALALQAQFGPGGKVQFPEGNHTYLLGHIDPADPTNYIEVTVNGFNGQVLGAGATIAAFDSQTFPFGVREYMLRFDGGNVRMSDLVFTGSGKNVGGCVGLLENSSTITNCHFEDFGRSNQRRRRAAGRHDRRRRRRWALAHHRRGRVRDGCTQHPLQFLRQLPDGRDPCERRRDQHPRQHLRNRPGPRGRVGEQWYDLQGYLELHCADLLGYCVLQPG